MKKLFYFAAAAVALAACAKNEVIPVNSGESQEITFNVAPKTKADPQTFSTDNVFASWAYYLPNTEGTSWAKDRLAAKIYIGDDSDDNNVGVTISYDKDNRVWKNVTNSYYWPKDGKLTFFAYSLNRGNLDLTHSGGSSYPIQCHNAEDTYGINATIDLNENKNLDLLVAEIAADKTENETFHSINGVPTLFKHKFSRVQFAVKKNANCGNATITLKSIKFNNVAYSGHYCQYNKIGETYVKDYCEEASALRTAIDYTTTDFPVTSSDGFVPVTNEIEYIYFPQDFKDVTGEKNIAKVEVIYDVEYSDKISETYTKALTVKDIFDSWEVGKKYTFNLIFSLNEITWAPVVQDWEPVTKEIEIK